MPISLTIHHTDSCLPLHTSPSEKKALRSPLVEHIEYASASAAEFHRHEVMPVLEERQYCLKNNQWHRAQVSETTTPHERKLSLQQVIAGQNTRRQEISRYSLPWTLGLLTFGVSACTAATYVWLRLKNDTPNVTQRIALNTSKQTAPHSIQELPFLQALIAGGTLPPVSAPKSPETLAVIQCPVICKDAAALARCENIYALHIPQKPDMLMLKGNTPPCCCPGGVTDNVIVNNVEESPDEARETENASAVYRRNITKNDAPLPGLIPEKKIKHPVKNQPMLL